MHAAKSILCVVLAVAICMAVIPLYTPMDVTREHNVDPEDAIILTQNIDESAEDGLSINYGLEISIEAFHVVAKLRSFISSVSEEGYSPEPFKLILPSFYMIHVFSAPDQISKYYSRCQSSTIHAEMPPHRNYE